MYSTHSNSGELPSKQTALYSIYNNRYNNTHPLAMPVLIICPFKNNEEKLQAYKEDVNVDDWPLSVKRLLINNKELDNMKEDIKQGVTVDAILQDLPVIYRSYTRKQNILLYTIIGEQKQVELSELDTFISEGQKRYHENKKEMTDNYIEVVKDIETIKLLLQDTTGELENEVVNSWVSKFKKFNANMNTSIEDRLLIRI